MKILFIADPFSKLKPHGDTTLALLRQALKIKFECYWTTDEQVEFENKSVWVTADKVESCEEEGLPITSEGDRIEISKFKYAFIRKDPPFNAGYVRLCWILALAEKKTIFVNFPSLLLRYHEKLVPLEALAHGYLTEKDIIPTHVGSYETAKLFVKKLGAKDLILKPFLGFGGRDIIRLTASDFLQGRTSHSDLIVQPFQTAVSQGDHRVFFINGKNMGSIARIPKLGHFVSNLAAGGTAKAVALTKSQKKVMEKTGKFLKSQKIFFAGADLIGDLVSEVNITSPTGFVAHKELFGDDLSAELFKELKKCRLK